ncbi:MAG: cytosolic protein [Gammaproteobacteria bacterium]|nr:cytosolic protein [Gammaproteobacteria bacterium]
MKVFMLYTGSGPLVILTSHENIEDLALLVKLAAKGVEKFIAFEIPYELAEQRYGGHFAVVKNDLGETDDLRVLDYNGERAIKLFRFDEMGKETRHEP